MKRGDLFVKKDDSEAIEIEEVEQGGRVWITVIARDGGGRALMTTKEIRKEYRPWDGSPSESWSMSNPG